MARIISFPGHSISSSERRRQTAKALEHCLAFLLKDAEAANLTATTLAINLAIDTIRHDLTAEP